MPGSDTYIEKEAQINEEIDRLRHACTQALLTRKDVIVVASVSCIYNIGSPTEYEKAVLHLQLGQKENLPVLFISNGDASKKAVEWLDYLGNVIIYRKLE